MHFHAVIPAWGERCVAMARQYVIPSVKAAIQYAGADVRLIIYSDRELSLDGIDGEYRSLTPPSSANPVINLQGALRNLHHWTIAEAPPGSAAVLFNADTVVSREFFSFAAEALARGRKVVAATALRALIGPRPPSSPPIGAVAADLLEWAWNNRHPIAEDCVLGRGRTTFPNTVILDRGPNVVLHSVHLHPFCIVNDGRVLKFKGTIDDDLLAAYSDDEVGYIANGEVGFAELSPPGFKSDQYGSGPRMSVQSVVEFGRNSKWMPCHIRNFRQPIAIRGVGDWSHPYIEQIVQSVAKK